MNDYSLGIYEKAMPNNLTIKEKLSLAKKTDFDYMELSIDESPEKLHRLYYNLNELKDIRNSIIESGIYINSLCLSAHRRFPMGSHDESIRDLSLKILQRAIDLSCILGIRIIQLAGYDVYYEQGDETSREYFKQSLKYAASLASSKGIILAIETMETPFIDTVEKAMYYVRLIDSPYLGIYPDIGNLTNSSLIYNHSITEDINLGKGHIFAAHLKETMPGTYRNLDFGNGHTKYISCIRELYSQGVRMFTGEFWNNDKDEPRLKLLYSSNFLRSKIEQTIN